MYTLAQSIYLDSSHGETLDMPHAGSSLENVFVYDAVARDMKKFAERGLIEIVNEHQRATDDGFVIDQLRFRRLR